MSDLDLRADVIRKEAKGYGLSITAHDGIVTVQGTFTPGDADAFNRMESNARAILTRFKWVAPGSIWGTDSASVGGHVALTTGRFILSKSGVEKRLAARFV
jgi:hypothetical protein